MRTLKMANAGLLVMILGFITISASAQKQTDSIRPLELRTKGGARVWLYLPEGTATNKQLPCVLVPPAGSRLFVGMHLSSEDQVEQAPYAKAGFVVVSFDISGPSLDTSNTKELRTAMRSFQDAQWGIKDAFEALAVAQAKYPQIDRKRVYVAGHSSAATLSLQIASSTNQISGCVAFAPVCDLEQRLGSKTMMLLDSWVPGTAASLKIASPRNRVGNFKCPVFLFHALDDDNVSPTSVIAFKTELLRKGVKVEYVSVPSGGHYDSMVNQGLPAAIRWLKRLDAGIK